MTIKKATKTPTEATIETRAKEALLKALPWLGKHKIEQQTTFTLRFGHALITVDGKEKEYVSGRADILVYVDDVPTIVLELKRPGKGITDDDVEQGLSYARVLHPRPPLVLATDGTKDRIVETHTGVDWAPLTKDEQALKALLKNVALVAADEMKRAVSRLLGNDPTMWVTACRAVSTSFIEERTGDWSTPDLPFVDNFLLPRDAVKAAIKALEDGTRLLFITGGPLGGKSSALRELSSELATSDEFAVMMLDADSGIDLFSTLSDILSAHFFWPLSPFEARHWVQQLSRTTGPALVLAIDDFDGSRGSFLRDLEALTSDLFGDRIRVALAVDEAAGQRLSLAGNGRASSALKRRGATDHPVGKLSDSEFASAKQYLRNLGVLITPGGEHTPELRLPWVLRAMCSDPLSEGRPSEMHFHTIASMPTLWLLQWARDHFDLSGLLGYYRELAQALVDDVREGDQSVELRLESLEAYQVRRGALREVLAADEIAELLASGLLREARSGGGEAVFVAQLPLVVASEVARLLAGAVMEAKDHKELALDLVQIANAVPLGPVVVASAVVEAANKRGALNFELFKEWIARAPRTENMPVGTTIAFRMPDGTHIDLKVDEQGRLAVSRDGRSWMIDLEEGDELGSMTADPEAWLILSHLAMLPTVVETKDGSETARFDEHLLLTIGAYPGTLIETSGRDEPVAFHTHEFAGAGEMVCSSMGIVEPITFAIHRYLNREPGSAAKFVKAALSRHSPALLYRIHTAMRFLIDPPETLQQLHRDVVLPAIVDMKDE